MLVVWDLGFVSQVLIVLCCIFPVIGLIIRHKWRASVARQKEIERLIYFASQEVARAELEAATVYGGPISVVQDYQCAVCYSPTTTRCAQCKAVRYCSGKCQIIHWRQGHKEECRPPSTSHPYFDKENFGQQAAVQEENAASEEANATYSRRFGIEGKGLSTRVKTFTEEGTESCSGSSFDVTCSKDDNVKVEWIADRKDTNSAPEHSDTSFSGFSASNSSIEASDDASISDSSSSHDMEKQDGHLFADTSSHMLDTTGINNLDQSKPLSPKFASLVDSVEILSGLSKSNEIKPGCSGREIQCKATSSTDSGMHVDSSGEPFTPFSSFWRKTLDSVGSGDDAHVDSAPSNSHAAGGKDFLQFSFNLSDGTIPPFHPQDSEANGILFGDTNPTNLVNKNPVGTVFSKKMSHAVVEKDSPSLKSNLMENGTLASRHVLNAKEVRSSSSNASSVHLYSNAKSDTSDNVPNISRLSSFSSLRSNNAVGGTENTLGMKSTKVKSLSSTGSEARSTSGARGNLVSSVESGDVGDIHIRAAISSQTAGYIPNARNGLKMSMLKAVDQFRGEKSSKDSAVWAGSEIAGRYSAKGLFPYDLFVKLYNWNKEEQHPCGLINVGNSCYANAVLQCLAFTPPLTAYFLQGLHSKSCSKKEQCFSCEFESLILKANGGKSPLSPIGVLSQLKNISQLGSGREEDAHEFLTHAINAMQSVCLMEAGVKSSGFSDEETTLIGLTFGGYLRSKIKCLKCGGMSERQERMMDLTVEIEGDIGTLEEALRKFTGTEILDDENKYKCSRCKSYEKAKKKLKILEAPNVLTIVLKRFQSGKFGKLNKPIRFPEILDLAPYMSGTSDKSPIYRLYGVIVHLDIMNAAFSGHYVCYVKNIQNKWFKIDDSTVTTAELERVLGKGAYMLLYARCSPRAPRLIRNGSLQCDTKIKAIPPRGVLSKSRVTSSQKSCMQIPSLTNPSDGQSTFNSFYSRFHRLQRILKVDSSSDNSSLISSNSDEGSCSTESTSTEDFSDYIFGETGHSWNSPWRTCSDTDTSSTSSSPLYTRHSHLASSDQCASGFMDCDGRSMMAGLEGKGSHPILHSNTNNCCRNIEKSNSCSCRETNCKRLGLGNPPKPVVTSRKSVRETTE